MWGGGGQVTELSPAETSGYLANEAVKINNESMCLHLLFILLGVLLSQLGHLQSLQNSSFLLYQLFVSFLVVLETQTSDLTHEKHVFH